MATVTQKNRITDLVRDLGVHKFGANGVVGTSAESVWPVGGLYTGFLTSADTLRIAAGGNAADTAAGAGARSIMVEGLDTNWNIATEEIATNGISASSSTSTSFIRFYRAWGGDMGTYGVGNTGNITIETTGGTTVGMIEAGMGQTKQAIYTVPALYEGLVSKIILEVESSNTANVQFFQRRDADVVSAPFSCKRIVWEVLDFSGHQIFEFDFPHEFPSKTDLWFDATKVTGGGDAKVSVDFDVMLQRE